LSTRSSSTATIRRISSRLGIVFDVPLREQPQNRHVASPANFRPVVEPVQPLTGRRELLFNGKDVYPDQLAGKRVPNREEYDARGQALVADGRYGTTTSSSKLRRRLHHPERANPNCAWIDSAWADAHRARVRRRCDRRTRRRREELLAVVSGGTRSQQCRELGGAIARVALSPMRRRWTSVITTRRRTARSQLRRRATGIQHGVRSRAHERVDVFPSASVPGKEEMVRKRRQRRGRRCWSVRRNICIRSACSGFGVCRVARSGSKTNSMPALVQYEKEIEHATGTASGTSAT